MSPTDTTRLKPAEVHALSALIAEVEETRGGIVEATHAPIGEHRTAVPTVSCLLPSGASHRAQAPTFRAAAVACLSWLILTEDTIPIEPNKPLARPLAQDVQE